MKGTEERKLLTQLPIFRLLYSDLANLAIRHAWTYPSLDNKTDYVPIRPGLKMRDAQIPWAM